MIERMMRSLLLLIALLFASAAAAEVQPVLVSADMRPALRGPVKIVCTRMA
jgi:hypothetical protein